MGAPVSEKQMKIFLKLMFNDKAILNSSKVVRFILSFIISNLRYKSSWKKYLKIQGSPLQNSMNELAKKLQLSLNGEIPVHTAFSYSEPLLEDKISELCKVGINDITIISMYPQASFSTTGSIQTTLDKCQRQFSDLKIRFVDEYFDNKQFIDFWVELIKQIIVKNNYQNPHLLFTSHALPVSFVKRGDKYVDKIQLTASSIAETIGLPYSLGYQSKIGPLKWIEPNTKQVLVELKNRNLDEIILLPISFINENLETSYDLDFELIPYANNILKINNICRVILPEYDPQLIKLFKKLIATN